VNDIKKITNKINKFRDDRNWLQFHKHKDMAIALSLEASEVLEHFLWLSEKEQKEHGEKFKKEIGEELADVAKYLFELADNLDIDLADAIKEKMKLDSKKYPIEKAKGKHTKYDKL
jgi:NTP pyrophosphatase (non-canonical NTP hydrolase)